MNNLLPRLSSIIIIALFGIQSFTQTTFYESFDSYTVDENFVEQAIAAGDTNWLLWSGDTNQDARISSTLSLSPDNSLLVGAGDDIVFYPGSYTSGRWFFSGHINVVSGHTAYFNMMHNWDTTGNNNLWACQVFFNANGTGKLNVGGQNYSFNYAQDAWLYFSMEMDIDNDTAIFWINDEQIHKWPWHYRPNATNGTSEFEAVDFYGWGDASYYLDEVTVSTDAVIRFEDASTVWDGNPKSVTVKTYPPNISYDLTYNDSTDEPTEPGTYTVEAVINQQGYSGSATGTLTINKATATVEMTDTEIVYDGLSHSMNVVTTPGDLTLDITYNGSSNEPIYTGTYLVEAAINDTYYVGTSSAWLTVQKATADISFSQTEVGYNGTGQGVVIETSPAGLFTTVTYNGLAELPVERGVYTVLATIEDVNYEGTATTSFEILIGQAEILMSGLNPVYNGSEQNVTIETVPAGLSVGLTYNGEITAPVSAGSYEVIATINDANYEGTTTQTLVIDKAPAEITLTFPTLIFDGTQKGVELETLPEALSSLITYNGLSEIPVNAGSYEVIVTIDDANYQGSVTETMVIEKADASITISELSKIYNGTEQDVVIETNPLDVTKIVTYNGLSEIPVNAGSYEVVVTIDDANYQGSVTETMVIEKADASILLSELSRTYNGTEQTANIETVPLNLSTVVTYNGSSTIPVNAGTYEVVATINESNYQGSQTSEFVINKAFASISISETDVVFDGTEKEAQIVTEPVGLSYQLTYNGLSDIPVNAGDYLVDVLIMDENYMGEAEADMIIQKAEANIMLTREDDFYDGTEKPAVVEITPSEIEYSILYNGQINVPVNAGDYNIDVNITDNNYFGSASSSFIIEKAEAEIILSDLEWEYTGYEIEPTISTNPEELSLLVLYNEQENKPIEAGEYAVSVIVNEENYFGEATNKIVISAATQTIYWEQEFSSVGEGDTIELDATSSSDLEISFISGDESIAKVEGKNLIILKAGETDIIAIQEGNINYLSTSITKTITANPNSIGSPLSDNIQVQCWPNPVLNRLTVGIELDKPANIQVISQTGAVVFQDQIEGNNPDIDFSNFPTGLYIINLEYNGSQKIVKVTKR